MKRSPGLVSIVALVAVACGSKRLSPAAARILEVSDLELTDCTFLQKVQGTAAESSAVAQAKNEALERAARIGATHIKWIIPCCTSVEADAYRCDVPD